MVLQRPVMLYLYNMNKRKAIVIVTFGTTNSTGRENSFNMLEGLIRQLCPDWTVCQAYTSKSVRSDLAHQGIIYLSPKEQLEALGQKGYTIVYILPILMLPGTEYEKLKVEISDITYRFSIFKMGKPLLMDNGLRNLILNHMKHLYQEAPLQTCIVLIGHGSTHQANNIYLEMQRQAKENTMPYLFIGTLEASPDIDDVLRSVIQVGFTKAILIPLLYTAGVHTYEDIAGNGNTSWKTRFEKAGISVQVETRGLGEMVWIRDYILSACSNSISHISEIIA